MGSAGSHGAPAEPHVQVRWRSGLELDLRGLRCKRIRCGPNCSFRPNPQQLPPKIPRVMRLEWREDFISILKMNRHCGDVGLRVTYWCGNTCSPPVHTFSWRRFASTYMSAFLFWGSFTLSSSQKIPSRHRNSPILFLFGS
jgi:hypothetical protein